MTAPSIWDILDRGLGEQPEAEAAVLGCALVFGKDAAADMCRVLTREDFYNPLNQIVYDRIEGLVGEAHEGPWDRGVVTTLGKAKAQVSRTYVAGLCNEAVTTSQAAFFFGRIREAAALRAFAQETLRAMTSGAGYTLEESRAMVERTLALADRGLPVVSSKEAGTTHMQEVEERRQGTGGLGIQWPWPELNQLTGGLRAAKSWIMGARTSIGKTAVALAVSRYAAECGNHVLYVSLEMQRNDLLDRLYASIACIDGLSISTGHLSDEDMVNLHAAKEWFGKLPFDITDKPACSVRDIWAMAKRLPAGRGLLVVDYLQLVTPSDRRAKRNEQIASISRDLKNLAGVIGCPVLTLSSITRPADRSAKGVREKAPTRFDMKESGDIENDCDGLILLHRPDYGDGEKRSPVSDLEVNLEKQRNGPTGEFKLKFYRNYQAVLPLWSTPKPAWEG